MIERWAETHFPIIRFVFHRILNVRNPLARKIAAKLPAGQGQPLVRVKPKHVRARGVERVARVAGVRDGQPMLEDGRALEVRNVIWCTGYRPDCTWIDLPGFAATKAIAERERSTADQLLVS